MDKLSKHKFFTCSAKNTGVFIDKQINAIYKYNTCKYIPV